MIKRYPYLPVLILLLTPFPILAQTTEESARQENVAYERDDVYRQLELFSTALSYVLNNYYKDLTKEELEKLMSSAIKGMLQGLDDRYSFYQAETSRKREQENLFYAKFGGLGIRILPSPDGFVNIVQPMDGTPAMKAGLRSGDKILKVDGKSIENQSIEDVVDILRGEVGTKVTITILRPGKDTPFDVTITRDIINFPSVRDIMIGDRIGYISLSSFTAETPEELRRSIEKLKGKGMHALILDLRNNTGGMMSSAVAVANAFIPEGVIVSTDGRLDKYDSEHRAKKENLLCPLDMPLAVLVNDGSASGSEIVAGAVKDHKRGIIIGEKTFGKGVVQQRFPLNGDKAVSVTVSIYKTPNGTCIHETTLFSTDLSAQSSLDAGTIPEELRQAFKDNGITLSQSATVKVKSKGVRWQIRDDQKTYTIKKEEGKLKIYQGGIEPDIEVDQPNLFEGEDEKTLTKLYEGEYVDKFVYSHLEKYQDMDTEEQLKLLEANIPELIKTLDDNGIKLNDKIITFLVRRTFASTKYIPNIDLENDLQLARAVEEIRKKLAE